MITFKVFALVAWQKLLSILQQIFTVARALWCLEKLLVAIRFVYQAGYRFGTYYRQHLHQRVKLLSVRCLLVAVVLMYCVYEVGKAAGYYCRKLWSKRHIYVQHLEQWRQVAGEFFVYRGLTRSV